MFPSGFTNTLLTMLDADTFFEIITIMDQRFESYFSIMRSIILNPVYNWCIIDVAIDDYCI